MKTSGFKKWVISVLLLLILVLTATFFLSKPKSKILKNTDIVAVINGEQVEMGEFFIILRQNKSAVFDRFKEFIDKDGSISDEVFWNNQYNGIKPIDQLKEVAMQNLIRIKIEQQLARKNGLITEFNYTSFVELWRKENTRRKKAVKNNEAIYGPMQHLMDSYYNYVYTIMVTELKDKLRKKDFVINPNQIESYYQQNKKKYKNFELSGGLLNATSENMGYKPLAEVKDHIVDQYVREQYNKLVEEEIKVSSVELNHEVYNAIGIELKIE